MIGSLLIGLAIWCAAGTVAVASPDSATARLVVGAPWWMFVLGTVIGAAVPAWRTRPLTALPALLAVVPWLPIPLPAIAMIWTGPLAWVPILMALGLAVGLGPLRAIGRLLNLLDPDDATVAACVLAAVLGGVAAWSADTRSPGGDEPAYLMITQSLIKDGDLNIDNNHENRDYTAFMSWDLGGPDLLKRGKHGEGYSIHAPGVSVLVAPLFQFFGYTGARVMLILLTAIGSMLVWRLSWRVSDSAAAAWCAWAAVMLTPTFAYQSFMIYPDGPGFLAVAVLTLLLVQLSRGDTPAMFSCALGGVALASLPWFHTRFAILAAGFGAAVVLRLLWPGGGKARAPFSRVIAFVLLPAISVVLWLLFFKMLYDVYDPRAPYPNTEQFAAWIVPAIIGLFFDGSYGLAAYAPAVALAFAGWWRRTETFSRRLGVELALIVFVYLAAVTTVRMWWAGGDATPARFLMALLPVLAVPIAVFWTRVTDATRALATALVAVGAGVTAVLIAVDRSGLAHNARDAQSQWLEWLSPAANLTRVWPNFFWDEPRFPVHVLLWCAIATALWLIARRLIANPRAAVVVWGIVTISVLAPVGWAFTGATALDPAPSQLRIIAREGAGERVYAISVGTLVHLRSLKGTMTLRPLEPGVKDPPPLLAFRHVPGARYIIHVTSTSPAPAPLRLFVGLSATSPWREFTVPGVGAFTFPFVLPTTVAQVVIDTNPDLRSALGVELAVEDAMPQREAVAMKSAAHYGLCDVLFFDEQMYVEADGFWTKGRQATRFMLVPSVNSPVSPLTVRVLVRNGGAANIVTIESGTFQRLLQMAPYQELDVDVPLTPTGTANVRVASGDGFVPADSQPGNGDRRLLGVWIQPR